MTSHLERLTGEYSWALWLAAPIVITVLAALWMWWRGRSRGVPAVGSTIADHHRYLDMLSTVAAKSVPPALIVDDHQPDSEQESLEASS